jgi:hypothetical protein
MDDFYAGRIGYYGPGGENGREWFEMVPHAGGRTLRAFCEMDEVGLSRDVSIALDADSRPLDAFVRVIQGGAVRGSTLFLVEPGAIDCEGVTLDHGRVSQRKPLATPLTYLGLHPLVGDALVTIPRGTGRRGEFVMIDGIANSLSPNGELGLIAMPTHIDVAYLGEERVRVPAGEFEARRYALRWNPAWPPADIWVHGPLALFLRLRWEMIDAHYELTELRRSR